MERTGEMIGVEVSFWGAKIFPLRFVWNGRRHEVKRLALRFERKDGGRKYICFDVDTGGMMVELAMDKESLNWRVAACEPSCT